MPNQSSQSCPHCAGSGECPKCDGFGEYPDRLGAYLCEHCHATGRCPACQRQSQPFGHSDD